MVSRSKIFIRVDGNKTMGMGHVYRQITLAKHLKMKLGAEIIFIVRNNKSVVDLLSRNAFKVYPILLTTSMNREKKSVREILLKEKPDGVIVDLIRSDNNKLYMRNMRAAGSWLLAFTDDPKKRIIDADVVISSDPAQKPKEYEAFRQTQYHFGLDYVLLDERYAEIRPKKYLKSGQTKVLVCMGGADHHNLTFKVLKAVDQNKHQFECEVILNSSFFNPKDVERFISSLRHNVRIYYDVDGLYPYLCRADLAITSGGLVHLERICAGVPGIVVNQILRQAHLSRIIAERQGTLDLGMYRSVRSRDINNALNNLIENKDLRERIRTNGLKIVDGNGLSRVADIISEML